MADVNRPGNQPASTRSQVEQTNVPTRRTHFPALALGGELFSMSPFAAMRRLSDEMEHLFGAGFGPGAHAGEGMRVWSPAMEVRQKGNDLVVCAELPGIDANEVNVEVNDDALLIEGERKREYTSEEGGYHRSERSYGRFYRTVPLPEGVKADEVKAKYNNGVLEVTIPMHERKENRRKIAIETPKPETTATRVK